MGEMKMGFWLAGLDEAGYGPKLGPMVIAMATLRSEDPIEATAPWSLLAPTVGAGGRGSKGMPVADSKRLHRSGTGDLSRLEEAVLAFVAVERGKIPSTFRELLDHLTAGRSGYLSEYPWYQDGDIALPTSLDALALSGAVRRLERTLDHARLAVAEVRAIPLEVIEFNSRVAEKGSKGIVDAWAMGRFLKWLWLQTDRDVIEAWTDRLGGRERYGPLLYPLFKGAKFDVIEQQREKQIYRATSKDGKRRLTVRFQKDGEQRCFTTALASMTAKYLRELHMKLLNRWWQEHLPELRPTAGYPQDAPRFIAEVESKRLSLGIPAEVLIRQR
ncbi:MAG TPA: hypothetical protein EYN79_08765 [Planctomycetes bacterium]|nr:hypothetical protein [Planctomycetota bacterium]